MIRSSKLSKPAAINQRVSPLTPSFLFSARTKVRTEIAGEHLPVAHVEKNKKTKTSLPHNPDASSASANKVNGCLRTAEPWGRGIKKHVKSMRVFLFPDLVFPCSLILPLSGVSAQVSSLLIGQDWDGRNSWSALTHRPMIYLFLLWLCKQRSKRGCFWACLQIPTQVSNASYEDQTVNSFLEVQKFSTYPVFPKLLVYKVLNISLKIILLSSLINTTNNKVTTPTSLLKARTVPYSKTFINVRRTEALLTPKGA